MKFNFRIDIKKRHLLPIIAMIALVGFVIAQTPPNQGHIATQVNIGGAINSNLEVWANNMNGLSATVTTQGNSIATLQNQVNNCPSGMREVADFCIDEQRRASGGQFDWATITGSTGCSSVSPGLRLCSGVEWVTACNLLRSQYPSYWPSGSEELAGDKFSNSAVVAYGLSSCDSASQIGSGQPRPYRCCKNLV